MATLLRDDQLGTIDADTFGGNIPSFYTNYADSAASTAISNLVDGAPAVLDTLNELAAAIGDDANFITTINGSIALKLNSSAYTAADVKSKYESNADTNEFSDAEQTKLTGIETAATADQSNVEIKSAYEANTNTNAYTDTDVTKLSGIESGATGEQTLDQVLTAGSTSTQTMSVGRIDFSSTYTENYLVVGGTAINTSTASLFSKTISGATTFTFTGAPASGRVGAFTLELTNGGSAVVTWPGAVKWEGGTAPTLTASGLDILTFHTRNTGSTWIGYESAIDVQ